MRILHTSDWHVGRTVRGRSRADEQRAVLAEIAGIARDEDVDLVVVAGDLFDTAAPPPEAEQIVYRALLDLVDTGAHVVLVAGNHDNPRRLAAVKPLLDLARVHTGAYLTPPDDGGVVDLATSNGEQVRVALLPFLSQRTIVSADDLMSLDADRHSGKYAERCRQIISTLTAGFTADTVNVIVAHLTVVGGTLGGGEREAHTIFDYHVPPQVFPTAAHYVALGHLHRPQSLAGPCPIWYSGSPLHLDFGEAPGTKAVLLVDAAPGTPAKVREVPLRSGRRLVTVKGTLEQLEAQRDDLGDAYLRVVLDEAPRPGLADDVRERFPLAVDVAVTRPDREDEDETPWTLEHFQRSPDQLFADYLDEVGVDDAALSALFHELLEEVRAPDPA